MHMKIFDRTKADFKKRTTKTSLFKHFLTRWKDNSVVTVVSSSYSSMPMGDADRWSKAAKKRIKVSIPHSMQMYNKYMGGTDRMDENTNNNRISIRGKKWWWSIFIWLVDVSIQNAWFLSRQVGNNISQLNFRREIAMSYCEKISKSPKETWSKTNEFARGYRF